ncbi:MAG: hypothetical protein ACLSHL_09365 [Alistipes communis]
MSSSNARPSGAPVRRPAERLLFPVSETRQQLLNQVVKVINAHFSNIAIPHQIAMLEQRTRELKALSIEILNLAEQAKEWLRI